MSGTFIGAIHSPLKMKGEMFSAKVTPLVLGLPGDSMLTYIQANLFLMHFY